MCETIIMPDGTEIESIDKDGTCLCGNSQTEILSWIVNRMPIVEVGQELEIYHSTFGWEISIKAR